MKGDTMKKDYLNNQAADYMIVGFDYHGMTYYHKRRVSYFADMWKYDKTSKSHGRKACLRFKPTAEQKRRMIEDHAILYSETETFFRRERQEHENRGQTWERVNLEDYGEDATPCKNRAWWNGGDIKAYDEYIIQVKYEGGTICTAEQCRAHRNDYKTPQYCG